MQRPCIERLGIMHGADTERVEPPAGIWGGLGEILTYKQEEEVYSYHYTNVCSLYLNNSRIDQTCLTW